jgi:hypothetical protein
MDAFSSPTQSAIGTPPLIGWTVVGGYRDVASHGLCRRAVWEHRE